MAFPKVIGEYNTLMKVLNGASIARYGDGEINLVLGHKCVPQLMTPGISAEMQRILWDSGPNCIVGIPYVNTNMPDNKSASWAKWLPAIEKYLNPKSTYYSAFISRPDSAPWIATEEYFELVRSLWKDKEVALVWGGYRSLYPEFLRKTGAAKVHSVLCSYEDAYAQIDQLERQVIATGAKRVILCAGPTATCLAHRLSQRGVHAIDLGHIALFWKYAGGEEAIKIAPVAVLPPVEQTKAQIKEYGLLEEKRIGALWWPRCDSNPEKSYDKQIETERVLMAKMPQARGEDVAVLVGAGAGPLTAPVAEYYKRVYAFEPDFGMFGSLRRNLQVYKFRNVAFYKEAVGDVVGTVRMLPGKEAGNWTVDNERGIASVMQTTIDAMELDACDLIVTNVGKYHDKVIAGAQQTIAKFNPRVVQL